MSDDSKITKIYGFELYIDGTLGASSNKFFLTREAVKADLRKNVEYLCGEISQNTSDFTWDADFDPEEPNSYDPNEVVVYMKNYDRIKHLVSDDCCERIYACIQDSPIPIENDCPYDLELFVRSYELVH